MLTITITRPEQFDEVNELFIEGKSQTIQLEHSLISISKWESKWHKPFLTGKERTKEQSIDYIRCMTITQNVDHDIYRFLSDENANQIEKYMNESMTASVVPDDNKKIGGEQITAELMYYWMVTLNIPFECEKWHLNRLISLIKVCNFKSQPPKKKSMKEIMARNAELNEQRRKQLNSKG